MEFLAVLWLPILLSAVAVFVVSSIFHMVLPLHKGDTQGIPNEVEVADALRGGGIQPGEYMVPYCGDMKEMGTPEYRAKLDRGPVLTMTVMPNGPLKMGQSLVQWFVYSLVIGILVAYVGHLTLDGAAKITVFRVLGTVAILPYAVAHLHDIIWRNRPGGIVAKFVFGGLVYGLVTGAVFAWLWPAAM
jgi:hypothetical protein